MTRPGKVSNHLSEVEIDNIGDSLDIDTGSQHVEADQVFAQTSAEVAKDTVPESKIRTILC